MRFYCSESKNSKLIIERFIHLCETRDQVYLAGPKGSEFILLLKEYYNSFDANADALINLQVSMLDETVVGEVLSMLSDREHPGLIAIDTRGNYSNITEAILLRFLDKPAFTNVRIFILLEDMDPFEETNPYSAVLTERAKESLFILPPLKERLADVAHFSMQLLREYEAVAGIGNPLEFDSAATDLLLSYPWPGNYEELSHVIKVIVMAGVKGGLITRNRLEESIGLMRTSPLE